MFEEQGFRLPAGTFFAGTKNVTKEMPLEVQGAPVDRASRGFFDSPSWLGRKTAHIHVRRHPVVMHAVVLLKAG
jgi:hypothetical protein